MSWRDRLHVEVCWDHFRRARPDNRAAVKHHPRRINTAGILLGQGGACASCRSNIGDCKPKLATLSVWRRDAECDRGVRARNARSARKQRNAKDREYAARKYKGSLIHQHTALRVTWWVWSWERCIITGPCIGYTAVTNVHKPYRLSSR